MANTNLDFEIVYFLNNLSYDRADEWEKMDLSEAIFTMCEWMADGVEYPEGMTPEKLMVHWNHYIDSMHRHDDLDQTDDSDGF